MKKLGIVVLLLIGGVVGAGAALYLYADSESTWCYGVFKSRDAAERAADAGREAEFGADVDHRRRESAVTFRTGETGEDAREARQAFRQIVRRERGELGHPGGGCLERKPIN